MEQDGVQPFPALLLKVSVCETIVYTWESVLHGRVLSNSKRKIKMGKMELDLSTVEPFLTFGDDSRPLNNTASFSLFFIRK